MFRVPVMTYLELAGDVTRADFKLKHQRVADGFVLFSTDSEMARLKILIDSHNRGVPLPFLDPRGENSVWEAREHLVNLTLWWRWMVFVPMSFLRRTKVKTTKRTISKWLLSDSSAKRVALRREVSIATQEMLEDVPEEIELQPGQTVLPIEQGIEGARLLMQTEKKERYTRLDDKDGEIWLTVFRKNRETGQVKEHSHKVSKRHARTLWVWIQRHEKGAVITSKMIREYIAPFWSIPVDAWAGHAHRSEYFEGHYYPLLWLCSPPSHRIQPRWKCRAYCR